MEGSEGSAVVAVVAVVPQEDLPGAHQVVRRAAPHLEALLLPAARVVRVRQVESVVSGPGVPLHPVVDPAVHQ